MSDDLESDWALVRPEPRPDPQQEVRRQAVSAGLRAAARAVGIDPDRFQNEMVTPLGIIYAATEPEHVGRVQIPRVDIPIVSETIEASRDQLEGWTCREMTLAEIEAENDPEYLERLRDWRERDPAGTPDTGHRVSFTMPVLQELWSRPWCVGTQNFLQALRPSVVRHSTGEVTTDSVPWRVTVFHTDAGDIDRIVQEVVVGGEGFRHGMDARNYYSDREDALMQPHSNVIVNARAVERLAIYSPADARQRLRAAGFNLVEEDATSTDRFPIVGGKDTFSGAPGGVRYTFRIDRETNQERVLFRTLWTTVGYDMAGPAIQTHETLLDAVNMTLTFFRVIDARVSVNRLRGAGFAVRREHRVIQGADSYGRQFTLAFGTPEPDEPEPEDSLSAIFREGAEDDCWWVFLPESTSRHEDIALAVDHVMEALSGPPN